MAEGTSTRRPWQRLRRAAWRPRALRRPATALAALALCLTAGAGSGAPAPLPARLAATNPCGPPVINPVACENTRAGTDPRVWEVGTSADNSLLGFSTDISINAGQTVHFKVDTTATSYTLDIYRVGYYQGNGARFIQNVGLSAPPRRQPSCLTDAPTGLIDCGNWTESATWTAPTSAVSGVYFALLTRPDTAGQSHIIFVVRNDASTSDVLFQTADSTWEAYNTYGGNSLYAGTAPAGRAYKVSYNRPLTVRNYSINDNLFYAEFPAISFLEQNGYDVSYFSGTDAARYGTLIPNHHVYLSAGHDEYWSGPQRANVTAARDAGVNMAFMSGNEMFWKTRWESSIDGTATAYRTMVTYKETKANTPIDPADPPTWTGTWRDPRFSPPADGGQSENSLTGQLWTINEGSAAIQIPARYANLRFWRSTSVAALTGSQVATLAPDTLGYEWDEEPDNGFRPAGLFDISGTTVAGVQRIADYGSNIVTTTAVHNMSLYRAASGALVFGAGTVQWTWGLTVNHDGLSPGDTFDVRIQQATVNVLADMGAQPVTIMSGMVAAAKSTDITPPVSKITSPAPGATFASGQTVVISGTAQDTGGVVAAVEVSTDNGATWHRAAGTGSWTYSWQASGAGQVVLRARAVDDSANLETPSAGVQVMVGCPCSIWNTSTVPLLADSGDGSAIEVGVKFRSDVNATVTATRFYKGTANTGTHVGHLWTSTGTLLASATFTNETASGWQTATFTTPVNISQNVTYVISYFAPAGHYSATAEYFYPQMSPPPVGGSVVDNGPVHALRDGVRGSNGVFQYTTATAFPGNSFNAANYWVDVLYAPSSGASTLPPVVTSTAPPDSANNVPTTTAVGATFNESIVAGSLVFRLTDPSGAAVPATVTYDDPSRTATLQPSAALAPGSLYSVSVQASDAAGNTMTSPTTWSFLTAGVRQCTCTMFLPGQAPQTASVADVDSVNLGVKFRSDAAGLVTGVRFYKGTGNTGVHVGSLWSSTGTLMASATFGSETATGWQNVGFSQPVSIQANTTYVASYFAPNGHYAITPSRFANSGTNTPPLHALAMGVDGPNGVYVYSGAAAFPASSFNATDYWVDVAFEQMPAAASPPTAISISPAQGSTGVGVTSPVSAQFNEAVQNMSIVVRNAQGSAAPGTSSYDPVSHTVTFISAVGLSYAATYTVTASASDLLGTPMATPRTWSFTTGLPSCPCSVWPATATPPSPDSGDLASIEIGVKFRSDVAGYVTAVRFYKASTNTGTHLGNLWTLSGQLLATGTFSGETASGWQQLMFSSPVPIAANTSYIASYFTSTGHYSSTSGGFSSAGVDNPPLHALANGVDGGDGVFGYGTSSAFPGSSVGSNYWVDVVVSMTGSQNTSPPAVTSESPSPGSTGIAPSSKVTFTFDKPVQTTSIVASLTPAGGAAVGGTLSYDQVSRIGVFTPSAPLALSTPYTASVRATDAFGNAMTAPFTWSFTVAAPACPCTIWPATATPGTVDSGDGSAIELGLRFSSDTSGVVTGIRFYKASANTGTHIGNLWTTSGTLLASAVFTGETGSGWQQVTFSGAVPVTAGTTYVVSYFTAAGHYSTTGGAFTSTGVDNPPLHALSSAAAGGNGVFHYGSASTFPTNTTAGATNYWVDPVFAATGATDTAPPTVTATSPVNGASGAPMSGALSATFSEAVSASSVAFTLSGPGGPVAGVLSYDQTSRTATFVPSASLSATTAYSASASATDLYGNAMAAPQTWTFTTGTFTCPCRVFGPSMTPATIDGGDGSAIELGMKFRSDVAAHVTAISFYKAVANTGTHTGHLWTSTGTLLAGVTFGGETASGWQTAALSTPVAISAGTTYVVSYLTLTGHYSVTARGFAGNVDSAPLHGLADGVDGGDGVFNYGSTPTFPTGSYNSTNYWVDVQIVTP